MIENTQQIPPIESEFLEFCGGDVLSVSNTNYFVHSPDKISPPFLDKTEGPSTEVNDEDIYLDPLFRENDEEDDQPDFWIEEDLLFLSGKTSKSKEEIPALDFNQKVRYGIYPFPFFFKFDLLVTVTELLEPKKDEIPPVEETTREISIPLTTFPTWSNQSQQIQKNWSSATLRITCLTLAGKLSPTYALVPPLRYIRKAMRSKFNEIHHILSKHYLDLLRCLRPLSLPTLQQAIKHIDRLQVAAFVLPLPFYDMARAPPLFGKELMKSNDLFFQNVDNFYFLIGGVKIKILSDLVNLLFFIYI